MSIAEPRAELERVVKPQKAQSLSPTQDTAERLCFFRKSKQRTNTKPARRVTHRKRSKRILIIRVSFTIILFVKENVLAITLIKILLN